MKLFANELGQEILLDVTNPTIVSYIKIVGFGTGYVYTGSVRRACPLFRLLIKRSIHSLGSESLYNIKSNRLTRIFALTAEEH